jgi:hypothetical protein
VTDLEPRTLESQSFNLQPLILTRGSACALRCTLVYRSEPLCTPVYPCVPLCTPVYPCAPLCTHVYPCVPMCTPAPCVPLCTPAPCVPLCTSVPLCTPVYPLYLRVSLPPPIFKLPAYSRARRQPSTFILLRSLRERGRGSYGTAHRACICARGGVGCGFKMRAARARAAAKRFPTAPRQMSSKCIASVPTTSQKTVRKPFCEK